jgi:hypothetical protein
MADIQRFIRATAKELGVGAETVEGATRGLFSFLREKLPAKDFDALMTELPGTEALLPEVSGENGDRDPLAAASGIVGSMTSEGLEVRQVAAFITEFLGFAGKNVDGKLLERVLSQVPDLKNVIE